jgi:riboflavin biosynthesis pyrimidine reductase
MPLDGLYLNQHLVEFSTQLGRTLFIADYLTDKMGVIAKLGTAGQFQVPTEIKNRSDWQLFQELMAQSDVIITSAAYFKRLEAAGEPAQDILRQFEPGAEFEKLGAWRLAAGFRRNPDLAVVARSLDFNIPVDVLASGRRILIFTIHAMADSDKAGEFKARGAVVVDSGEEGVDGRLMTDYLRNLGGYRVVMLATGPSVLQLLLKADRLDLLYITQVQVEISAENKAALQKILPEGMRVEELSEFDLTHQYLQENMTTENGSVVSELFMRYDKKGLDKK